MALKLAYTTDAGVVAPNAYHRVLGWYKPTPEDRLDFQVGSYLDLAAREAAKEPMVVRSFSMPLDRAATTSQFAQCSTWLKGQAGWEGAVDA